MIRKKQTEIPDRFFVKSSVLFAVGANCVRPRETAGLSCFIASFVFVLQMHRAKPIPLKMHKTKGSLREGAPDGVG